MRNQHKKGDIIDGDRGLRGGGGGGGGAPG
jgi:hypothetical protein